MFPTLKKVKSGQGMSRRYGLSYQLGQHVFEPLTVQDIHHDAVVTCHSRAMRYVEVLNWRLSMDWLKGKNTGKPHQFHGKIYGFRLRFSLKPIHWDLLARLLPSWILLRPMSTSCLPETRGQLQAEVATDVFKAERPEIGMKIIEHSALDTPRHHLEVSWNRVPPNHPINLLVFSIIKLYINKPSILGYLHLWKLGSPHLDPFGIFGDWDFKPGGRCQLWGFPCTLPFRRCGAQLPVALLRSFKTMPMKFHWTCQLKFHDQILHPLDILGCFLEIVWWLRQKLPPDVRIHVLQNFKPPQEGESDYSALVISYCKKTREAMHPPMHQPMHHPMHQPMQPMHQVPQGYQGRPSLPQRAPWSQPNPAPVAPRGLMGASDSNTNIYALEGFRQRYPMDDRAFDFLKCAPAFVQQQVLEHFNPQRKDEADYSALIISFAKKCREREQANFAAKRPRMFWVGIGHMHRSW